MNALDRKIKIAEAGHFAALIASAVLSNLDETFQGPDFGGRDADALSDETGNPGRPPIKDMRRALDRALERLDAALRKRDSGFGLAKIEKGPHTTAGLVAYTRAAWSELAHLETTTLDFTNGKLWLIPDLPGLDIFKPENRTLEAVKSWIRVHGSKAPRKLDGRFIVRVGDDPKIMSEDQILEAATPKTIGDQLEVYRPTRELGERAQTLGFLHPSEWTWSGIGDSEMIGIKNAAFARIVDALELHVRGPEDRVRDFVQTGLPAELDEIEEGELEGLWMVEYQDEIIPAEVAIAYDQDPAEPVVLLPGVGTERPLSEVRLLWRVKVWSEAEIMIKTGQLMADHGLRPDSFRAFVADLVRLVGGVR